jgi:hypothetical protein
MLMTSSPCGARIGSILLGEPLRGTGSGSSSPRVLGDASLLAASGEMLRGLGVRRLAVSRPRRHLKVEERWTSRGLKPYFNDIVVHNGHAYGFDGTILSATNLETGERVWELPRESRSTRASVSRRRMRAVRSTEWVADVRLLESVTWSWWT